MKFKRFMALAMAGVMTLAMTGTAMADVNTDKLAFTKNVDADANVTEITDKVTFTLTDAAAFDVDGKKYVSAGNLIGETPVTFEVAVAKADGKITGTQDLDETIRGKITKPGVYFLKLDETTAATETAFGWTTVDTKVYWIAAFAATAESGSGYTITYVAYEGTAESTAPAADATKVTELAFNNTYNKDSGDTDSSFEFTKQLGKGAEYVDANAMYEFTATLTYPSQAKKIDAKITDSYAAADASAKSDIAINDLQVKEYKFYLKGGDTAKFVDLPVGATVTVKETTGSINNWSSLDVSGDATKSGDDSMEALTLVEAKKAATFTNNFTIITPTGLAISVAPFIAMFAAVGAAIALYVAAKRRVR